MFGNISPALRHYLNLLKTSNTWVSTQTVQLNNQGTTPTSAVTLTN